MIEVQQQSVPGSRFILKEMLEEDYNFSPSLFHLDPTTGGFRLVPATNYDDEFRSNVRLDRLSHLDYVLHFYAFYYDHSAE